MLLLLLQEFHTPKSTSVQLQEFQSLLDLQTPVQICIYCVVLERKSNQTFLKNKHTTEMVSEITKRCSMAKKDSTLRCSGTLLSYIFACSVSFLLVQQLF